MWIPGWRFVLLGGLRAEAPGARVHRFYTQKTASLLGFLAFHRGRRHPREQLVEMLWPEADPAPGRNSLSVALSSLRHQLEPPGTPAGSVLLADRLTLGLNPDTTTTDVAEFEAALARAAAAPGETERIHHLAAALELYQGPLLPGCYEDWIPAEQERLAQQCFDAAGALLAWHERSGDLPAAVTLARRMVTWDPLREEAHRHLIRALAAAGQPGTAVRQYRELERLLDDELGVAPSASLRGLIRKIETAAGLAPLPPFPAAAPPPAPTAPQAAAEGPVTRTFLLTAIEASSRLREESGAAFSEVLKRCHAALREAFSASGGREWQETGDGFAAAFGSARQALAAAVAGQQALAALAGPETGELPRVRMALHTGDVEGRDGEYQGAVLLRAGRILTAAHGGQVLVSEVTAALLGSELPPDARLVDLGTFRLGFALRGERLFQAAFPGGADAYPPPRAEPGQATRLPHRLTRFFGREREMAILSERLREAGTHLVTLTGPAGVGKTRLALEVADRLASAFSGRVWFVPLADLRDPGLIADTILTVLGVPRLPQREAFEQVVQALGSEPALLVLDNCEHLVEGGAEGLQVLLETAGELTCLATSRRLLGLEGEQEWVLAPLPTPNGPDTPERLSLYDSVQLFLDRAQAVRPEFQVTMGNAPAVAELCDRLEGIPLALELAAARAQVYTPAQMLAQLDARFELLATRRRGVPERHRTLRAALDWSYQLLALELQRFFARLSVFRGGWTVEAAEAVCEEPLALDYLAELVECSLVQAEETEGAVRFRMLETLREYAREQIQAEEHRVLCRRHLEYYSGLPFRAWKQNEAHWWPNYEHALTTAAEQNNIVAALQLGWQMEATWVKQGRIVEGRRMLEGLLAHPAAQAPSEPRAFALSSLAILAIFYGDDAAAQPLLEESLSIGRQLGKKHAIHIALARLGEIAMRRGEYEAAETLVRESMQMSSEMGHVVSSHRLGVLALYQGQLDTAETYFEREDNQQGLVRVFLARGEADRALVLTEKLLGAPPEEPGYRAKLLALQGQALCRSGRPETALPALQECLKLFQTLQRPPRVAKTLALLGEAEHRLARHERAARLYAASIALLASLGLHRPSWEQEETDRALLSLRETLGDERYTNARGEGAAMGWEQAVAYALKG